MSPYYKIFKYSESEDPSHSPVFRSHFIEKTNNQELITKLSPNVDTLYSSLQAAIKKFGNKICFGSRRVIGTIEEVKDVEVKVNGKIEIVQKKWNYFQLSEYEWVTFNELNSWLDKLGSGLRYLGLDKEKKLALYAPTSHHWTSLANSCYTQSITAITIYDTLGEEGLRHGLTECEITTIYITSAQIKTLLNVLDDVKTLKNIITREPLNESEIASLKNKKNELNIYSFTELMELGEKNLINHHPPSPNDTALIMYTSGTTGPPKGVIISHANIVAIVAATSITMEPYLGPSDVIISFLPLAHILAFAVDCYVISNGMKVGYASPKTLTDASVRNCNGDLKELKPTVIVGVPQVYDSIRKNILNKIEGSGLITKGIFNLAYTLKRGLNFIGLPTFPLDALVFNKIKEQTGGRVKLAISGGAPISDDARIFFSSTVAPLIQGYGLTEVCGIAFVTTPDIIRTDCCGQVSPCLEFKIVDVPEANYSHKNLPPQGELWIRGASVVKGYYNNPTATKDAFTEDGWFKTGDIISIYDNGSIQVIDRKKNLVKLANGEYIATEKLEMDYKNSLFLANICVYADSLKERPIAIVQINLDAVNQSLIEQNLEKVHDLEEASKSKNVNDLIFNSLIKIAREKGFNKYETIAGVIISEIEWSPENGILTTSQKIRRKPLKERFQKEINEIYAKVT